MSDPTDPGDGMNVEAPKVAGWRALVVGAVGGGAGLVVCAVLLMVIPMAAGAIEGLPDEWSARPVELSIMAFAALAGGVAAGVVARKRTWVPAGCFTIAVILWTPIVLLARFAEPSEDYGVATTLVDMLVLLLSLTGGFTAAQMVLRRLTRVGDGTDRD